MTDATPLSKRKWTLVGFLAVFLAVGGFLAWPMLFPPATDKDTRTLYIGVHVPLTNENVKIWGVWAKQGIDLGVKDVLEKEGVRLDLEYSDDKNDVRESQQAASRYLQNDRKVWLVYLSRASTALAPIAKENDGLLITNTYTPEIVEQTPGFVVRIGQNAGSDAIAMAKFCAEHRGKKTMAIIHMETPAGKQTAETLKSEYEKRGGVCLPPFSYEANVTDFRPKLLQIKAQNPGILYIYGYNEIATIIRTARDIGMTADLCTNDVAEVPTFFERAGDAGNGVFYTALPFDPESKDPQVVSFHKKFEEANGGASPDVHAATWYDTTMILGRAFKASDGTVPGLRKALLEVKDYKGITGSISIRSDGDVDREMAIKVTSKGRYKLWKGEK